MKMPSLKIPYLKEIRQFISARSPGQRKIIFAAATVAAVYLDVVLFVIPPAKGLFVLGPEIASLKQEKRLLKEDIQKGVLIHQEWEAAKKKYEDEQKKFVASSELPVLLEDLSRGAQRSSVRLTSLKPQEVPSGSLKMRGPEGYEPVPIDVSAVAGTHEFGSFLSELESGFTFFRVKDIKISENLSDERHHLIELTLETYRRVAS